MGGFKIATEMENGQARARGGGAHAKVKLSLLILDSTPATRIKCSPAAATDSGTAWTMGQLD